MPSERSSRPVDPAVPMLQPGGGAHQGGGQALGGTSGELDGAGAANAAGSSPEAGASSTDAGAGGAGGNVGGVGGNAGDSSGGAPADAGAGGAGDEPMCDVSQPRLMRVAAGVACWGSNAYGQLGNGSPDEGSDSPVLVKLPP